MTDPTMHVLLVAYATLVSAIAKIAIDYAERRARGSIQHQLLTLSRLEQMVRDLAGDIAAHREKEATVAELCQKFMAQEKVLDKILETDKNSSEYLKEFIKASISRRGGE